MTEEELKAIEARAIAASAGPFHVGNKPEFVTTDWTKALPPGSIPINSMRGGFALGRVIAAVPEGSEADAEFFAHARTDVPALIAEVRRLLAEVERGQLDA